MTRPEPETVSPSELIARSEALSFDLFGTLVSVEKPDDPAAAVADELAARGVSVPDDWEDAYVEPHVEIAEGAELSLTKHVIAALKSRSNGPAVDRETVEAAVLSAFESPVETRPEAAAVETLADEMPVGILSNCAVPGLVERTLGRSRIEKSAFDAVVTSVGCGWRKPDERAFAAVASELGVSVEELGHVGDDPRTDGGAAAAGASCLLVGESSFDTREVSRWV